MMLSLRWFLRRLFPPRIPKPGPKYIGSVHGYSSSTEEDGEKYYYDRWWILTETAGKRRAKEVGVYSNSAFYFQREAAVEAWLVGGPIPPLGNARTSDPPKPKPRKSAPAAKPQGNVIAFAKKGAA